MKSEGDVILSADQDMAERIGKRIDGSPITLTIQVQKSLQRRVHYFYRGGDLYTAAFIPAGCFTGPPLPKEKPDLTPPPDMVPAAPKRPGSYTINVQADGTFDSTNRKGAGKKDAPWKKKRKRSKQRHERPPWRK